MADSTKLFRVDAAPPKWKGRSRDRRRTREVNRREEKEREVT